MSTVKKSMFIASFSHTGGAIYLTYHFNSIWFSNEQHTGSEWNQLNYFDIYSSQHFLEWLKAMDFVFWCCRIMNQFDDENYLLQIEIVPFEWNATELKPRLWAMSL